MKLFSKQMSKQKDIASGTAADILNTTSLNDELHELTSQEDKRKISRVDTEVKQAVSEAAKEDIRNIKMIEKGRCPVCKSRTEHFLFTVVCSSCGWFRRDIPGSGSSVVHLIDGEKTLCDYVHRGKDEYLCIKDGIVIAEIKKTVVKKIEHTWKGDDLEKAQRLAKRLKEGICSWCETLLADVEDMFIDYVAFGTTQERYTFCSEKCQLAFRKQYPSRVHRNCYETDCNSCDQCIKKYDTHGFKRNILR